MGDAPCASAASQPELINAHADEVALTKNVSEGLNIVAAGMPWQAGDNVVLCPELEHPNNVYCWLNQRCRGVEVRLVSPRGDRIPIDEMVARIDARTRVVTASTVTFAPGFRTEVDRLGLACRERGVFFMVDAAQSCGVLSTDVAASHIDGLAVSTQKGLLGLYGMGFLYCRRAWAEQMQPAYLARFSVDLGDAHEAALGSDDYTLMPAARRFDLGNYNFLGCAAADASMAQLLAYDIQTIERHVLSLSHQLAQGFLDLGLPVCGGVPGRIRPTSSRWARWAAATTAPRTNASTNSTRFSMTRTSVYRSAVASCAFPCTSTTLPGMSNVCWS